MLSLGLIKTSAGVDIDTYEELSDSDVRAFLDKKAEASKKTVTLSTLDAVVSKNLRMNMADRSAKSRMESLFVSYTSLLPPARSQLGPKGCAKGRRQTCSISHSSFFLTVQATG